MIASDDGDADRNGGPDSDEDVDRDGDTARGGFIQLDADCEACGAAGPQFEIEDRGPDRVAVVCDECGATQAETERSEPVADSGSELPGPRFERSTEADAESRVVAVDVVRLCGRCRDRIAAVRGESLDG